MTASKTTKQLETFGKHIGDTLRYSFRGTSIYKPEEAIDTCERQVQALADETRELIHEKHNNEQRIKYLERRLGIGP